MKKHNALRLEYKDLDMNFKYDPDTGAIHRKRDSGIAKAGDCITTKNKLGYLYVCHNYKKLNAARVAWVLHFGKEPKNDIDHIDGNRANNKISNLRDVTIQKNNQNRKYPRRDLPTGVIRRGARYKARVISKGKELSLGTYSTPDEAQEAYKQAKKEIYENGRITYGQ